MLRRKSIRFLSLFLIFLFIFSLYSFNRFSYSEEMTFYSIESDKSEFLKIGIIGDSWVSEKKLDSILKVQLLKNGVNCEIVSSGHSGARSKLIYQNLFKKNNDNHSSKFVIEESPDYCIVIAGVNDTASQIGANNYAYHLIKIIKTLLHYKIKPIIVTLPEFGIEETTETLNLFSKARNISYAYFNNKGVINNIESYRNVLKDKLESSKLDREIILVDFDNVCEDYNNCLDLYKNPSHLSLSGNKELCDIINIEIIKAINYNE